MQRPSGNGRTKGDGIYTASFPRDHAWLSVGGSGLGWALLAKGALDPERVGAWRSSALEHPAQPFTKHSQGPNLCSPFLGPQFPRPYPPGGLCCG